jgi:hypothetical protein
MLASPDFGRHHLRELTNISRLISRRGDHGRGRREIRSMAIFAISATI